MIYVDTSAIVKLYVREDRSSEASSWLRKRNQAIPFTALHQLELTNAVKLKQFRAEISNEEAAVILKRLDEHEAKGVFYRPRLDWAAAFALAIDLSKKHTRKIGARSLDVIHVACALSIGAAVLFTFDERQAKLAVAAGLKLADPMRP
ncbi:MAG: type II toxin-antitoxin system VapC family toxin [Desulfoferrobacter sp.]